MNTLMNEKVSNLLNDLHQKADADHAQRMKAKEEATQKGIPFERNWANGYMSVSQNEGQFLYFLANTVKAKNIVEYGCSFGISTIYLAAAAKNNGGSVVTSDLEPNKVAGARQNIDAAGLGDLVEIRQGDATQTLSTLEAPINFLFLDGAKDLYLQIFELLSPKLSSNAVIVADNADSPGCQNFIQKVLNDTENFITSWLFDKRVFVAYKNS